MKKIQKKNRVGSPFDDFLREEGIYEEVTARAIKRVIARQLGVIMREQGPTKTALARLRRQKEVGAAFGKYRWRGNLAVSRKGRGGR